MVKKKKIITDKDIDNLAFEISNLDGKARITRGGKPVQTVAPPTDYSDRYKDLKQRTDQIIRLNQKNTLKKLQEQLDSVQKKVQEPLKPIVKLQEKINKDIKPITDFQKTLLKTSFPFNPFFNFAPKGGGLLGTYNRKRKMGNTILGGNIKSKPIARNKPDKEKRKPSAIGLGLNSYMDRHKLVNPVEFAKVYPKNKDYKINHFIQLREVCAELNVNVEEALLYICEGMTSTDNRWRRHRIEKEFWRGSESIVNMCKYYKDKTKDAQSKGLAKYSVKNLWKSKYVKNIFNQNQAKVPSYPVFSQWFKKQMHHCEVLKLC